MAELKIFHANKIYDGGVHAIKDFDLEIKDGEFVVFVGPSGCGKSTTLRMIAGLEKITSGDVYIGDRLVNGLPAKERNIAMVFQSYALFPNMSVYDNISFGLRMQGEDKAVIEEKVAFAAKMLNLTDYLNRKPNQLSGGQKQRVALGRAIVRKPDVFLLDEPLSNLDAKLRNKMRKEIKDLHLRLKTTFIYVTHDQTEAMTMGDKIVVMKDGVVMQTGSPTYLYRYPNSKFVAGFIGMPKMNFFNGVISLTDRLEVRTAFGNFPITGELSLRLDEKAKIDGKKVILGIRPEDISTERKKDTDLQITVPVSVIEELCTHTMLHGYIGEEEIAGVGQSGFSELGKTVDFYADTEQIHLFDGETECTILPEFAKQKTVKAYKKGDKLSIFGGEVILCQDRQKDIPDGEVSVTVAFDAFTRGGDIKAEIKRTFTTEQGEVSLLCAGGEYVYALGLNEEFSSFGLDVSKLDIQGEGGGIKSIKRFTDLTFNYKKCKEVSDDGKSIKKHYVVFGNTEVESYYEFNKKMYRLGKSIFKKAYTMRIATDNVRLASENESYPCFNAVVTNVLDYGDKQYSFVSVGDDGLFVEGRLPLNKEVTLAIDLDNVRVLAKDTETILF